MTTFIEQRVTCAVCGHESEFHALGSTNEMGYPDLDTRPPEMARSTMIWWLQECPSCGYCSECIAQVSWGARVIVESPAFADFRAGLSELPDLVRVFRTAAYIASELGHHQAAFNHTLCEAWVHDDLGDTVRASAARLNALDSFRLVSQEEGYFDEWGDDAPVQVDLLRRAGAFDRAAEICEGVLTHTRHTGVGPIMAFELELCKKRDVEAHTMDEVPDRSRKWG
jgi:hypothetical protein